MFLPTINSIHSSTDPISYSLADVDHANELREGQHFISVIKDRDGFCTPVFVIQPLMN